MIVGSELEPPVVESVIPAPSGIQESPKRFFDLPGVAVFLFFLAIIVGLQIASGAYHCEFNGYPDEPAHYVTSLMLRDYLMHFHFQAPLRFAEEYYRHYPKVAFGHWPPLFYVLQSVWMMVFSVSRESVRLEIAVTCAALAYAVYLEARNWFGRGAGVLAGVLTVCLPLVQDYSDQEMAEALLTLCCFWSVIYFARYVQSSRTADSLYFGVFFSLAVLTKGSGWLLALVPPIVLVLTRCLPILRRLSFWYPVLLISAACIPWQLMTMRMAERGWDGGSKPSIAYTSAALVQFLGLFPKILGPIFVLFLLFGLYAAIVKPYLKGGLSAPAAAQFAFLVSVWIFHSVVPAGIEDRKLVIAVPAMILFVFAGARYLANLIPSSSVVFGRRYALVAAVGAIGFFITTFTVPKLQHYGFIEAARFLTSRPEMSGAKILVSSEAGGEGLLISEMAMDKPQPSNVILRATKSLADVGWGGNNYHSVFSNAQQISDYLHAEGVQIVVLDTFAPMCHFAHNALLRSAVNRGNSFRLIARFPSSETAGEVQIFKAR